MPPHYTQSKLKQRKAEIRAREAKLRARYAAAVAKVPKFRLMPGIEEIKRRVLQSHGIFVVAVCGPSSSGKTSIVKRLAKDLNAGLISTDSFYKPAEFVAKLPLYFDDVRSVDIDALERTIREWRQGKDISVPVHDPVTHEQAGFKSVQNTRVLFVEGIVALHPKIRKLADLKVYFDSSQSKRLKRKYRRDVRERSRSVPYARDRFYSTVEESRLQYMEQQKHLADMIVFT